ncbi:MAG: (d)CMP kinase [Mycobacteriales bacterium]
MSPAPRVIALDGPSGSGKSTVARGVAFALGLAYVDTGGTYRAATLAVLRAGVDPTSAAEVAEVVAQAHIELTTDPAAPAVRLDGVDVSAQIRGSEVTAAVSAVSAVPAVRTLLVQLQRRLIAPGAVVEGRDIGTVVVPDAPVKVYLDADPAVRAVRRAGDADVGVRADGDVVTAVAADLARRDAYDSRRADSPLQAAVDAVHLDATALDADQVIDRVVALATAAGFQAVP